MPTCAEVLASTLRDTGIVRIFGLPGGEVLDVIEASRRVGIRFLLTRHEATAALMADVAGQIGRHPGVCLSTLGPGAMNLTLGVANAFLDRSPLLAITAATARRAAAFATHQNLDLEAVFRPFTKLTLTLDGRDTAAKVRLAIATSLALRRGPVYLGVPSDVARSPDCDTGGGDLAVEGGAPPIATASDIDTVARELKAARRPVVLLGLDLDPPTDAAAVRGFVDALGCPVFVTPKVKGLLPEDHPLFCGVCAGVAGDLAILDFFARSDLLLGVGFDPVESDKIWHQTMKLVSVGPVSIAARDYRPHAEAVGGIGPTLQALAGGKPGPFAWTRADLAAFRVGLEGVLRPAAPPRNGVSGYELTLRLRELFPRDTIFVTDVGSVKMITSQAWKSYSPLGFLESNGLSAMSYALPAAMAARLQFPERPILCTIGDGGLSMTVGELETCVRERLHFVIVVFNDSTLSLIDAAQQIRGYPTCGVKYGPIDFSTVAGGFGAWSRRVATLDDLGPAVAEALAVDRVALIDVLVDPTEYRAHVSPPRKG